MGATFRQYLASAACTLSVAITATAFTWMEPLMKYLISPESEIPMTSSDTSWLVAFIEFGELLITVPAGILADKLGRKTVLLTTGPLCLLSWLLVLTTRSMTVIYIVRWIQGAGVAIVYTVAPMYIAEISEPRIRGELSGHFQTMWYVGILYSYLTGHFLSYQNYAYACSIGPIIFAAFFYLMPESPYYELMVDRPKAAIKSLSWLRSTKHVDEEFQSIRKSVEEDMKSKGGWRDLFATKKDIKAFLIVQTVCFIKYLNGMPAIVTYATQTFAESSNGAIKDYELTIGLGVLLIVATFCSAFISDCVGRRPLLIYSTMASVVFNIITGTYYFLNQQGYDVSQYSWVMFVSVAGFCTVSNIGLGPLMQTIQAEYFPSHTRGVGSGITEISASVSTFINLKQYQTVVDVAGIYMNFWIFALFGFLGTIFMYIVVPETAGKSLGQIQKEFNSTEKVDNAPRIENSSKPEDISSKV
ncbi:facilitated trehalose transporter Tret1 [Halyomorpha halys]|uniref:facilitated trehalose transporter Tret1 n=1 Tax=Halyomorpha halys TaxID=286706 RepID=UPI0006D4DBB4|nr:facilitated trehalose transporter Tret1-like [Halyomorpha halys]